MASAEEMTPEEEASWAATGQHIRDLRKQLGWKQEYLAEVAGVSVAYLQAIETRERKGTRHTERTLRKVSEGLDLAHDYLANYRKDYLANPPQAEAGSEAETARTAPPPRSSMDDVVLRMNKIVADCRSGIVSQLETMERRVRSELAEYFYNAEPGVDIDSKHSGEAE
jgi:transcriptional regulator with XRE-family HTH domain